MKIKTIITGSTGMVGEGILHECLNHSDVESVLVINRRSCNIQHPKLKEIIHTDFYDFSSIENDLKGYNAAFLCMGVSSVGMKEDQYKYLTYDLTMALAKPLARLNPDMTLTYVSGAATDSSEKGRSMWARVKGKTENDLLKLPIKQAYMFRPALITPTKGLKNTYTAYKVLKPILPVFRFLFPNYVSSLRELGLAMVNITQKGYDKKVLEVRDIVKLARM
ncbi:MAG: epimerase [Bacteroidetes bacterium GWF2_33_16]|nr:MAG: epimerase [Bacteroidetes bacterium GWE2_32_14]OFY02240.1 MAG: epimerase [Bacteroidetes bacterium GWF2_33_16]